MNYDSWKCSPPCQSCGTPNCLCDAPDESEPSADCCYCGDSKIDNDGNACRMCAPAQIADEPD
jgi:hypothetical protein